MVALAKALRMRGEGETAGASKSRVEVVGMNTQITSPGLRGELTVSSPQERGV